MSDAPVDDFTMCEGCGHRNPGSPATCVACGDPLSVASDSLDSADQVDEDTLVARASVPNLAALFSQAKAAGHIAAIQDYGNPA